jgi:hypothetical protein
VWVCSRTLVTPRVPTPTAPRFAPVDADSSSSSSCSMGLGAPAGAAPAAGYLCGAPHDLLVVKNRENALLRVEGVVGKLVALSNFLESRRGPYPSSVAEGDIRVWVDGARSPATHDTGYEDAFGGAHGYEFGTVNVGEALFLHLRRDTLRYIEHVQSGCIGDEAACPKWLHQEHPHIDLFSHRTFLADAIPFHHTLEVLLEGYSGDFDEARARGAALYYGAAAPRAPAVTDTLYPAVEVFEPLQARRHGYTLHPSARDGTSRAEHGGNGSSAPFHRYDFTSSFGGAGEPPEVEDGSCPVRNPGLGGGGIDYMECPAELLTLPALALAQGARVEFSLAIDASAPRCALRRAIDVTYSVQRAALRVEGVELGALQSSDRAFKHLNTRWKEALVHLPPGLTRGRSRVSVELEVQLDEAAGRHYPMAQVGEAWVEARWEAVCFYV